MTPPRDRSSDADRDACTGEDTTWSDAASGRADADDLRFFEPAALDRMMGMVMELAASLNVERYHRMALVEALQRRGLIDGNWLDGLEGDERFLDAAQAELSRDVVRLFHPIEDDGPPWQPLRGRRAPEPDSSNEHQRGDDDTTMD